MQTLCCIWFGLMCCAASLPAQPDQAARMERVENGLLPPVLIKDRPAWKLRERMQHYRVPGLSIAVWAGYRIQWARAYGVKDVETGEPVTETTLFQAGSISKPVAAMVALKKVQEGKLRLDEDINNRLTSWKLPDNRFTARRKVTLADLLSHTGGTTVHGFPGYERNARIPSIPEILDGAPGVNTAPVRVDLEPGTRVRYSGGGTTIAQLAVMDAERRPYPEIARDILDALGMSTSTYEQPLPPAGQLQAASGHRPDGTRVAGKFHVYPEMAAAGLWTTPVDLAKFAIEVQLSYQGKSNKVLTRETTRRMLTPLVDESACLGFFLLTKGDDHYFQHGGADEGFRAILMAHRDKGWGAAVMVNSDNGQILDEIVRSTAKEYGWTGYLPEVLETVAVAPAALDRYAGRYLINPDRVLEIRLLDGNLLARASHAAEGRLHPLGGDAFAREDFDIRYRFEHGSDKAGSVVFESAGVSTKAVRVPADRLVPHELLEAGRIDEGAAAYREIRRATPASPALSEQRSNSLGYDFLRRGKIDAALTLFNLNVEFYPESWNAHDSLAEGWMVKGDKAGAIRNYERSIQLNPDNAGGKAKLKELKEAGG